MITPERDLIRFTRDELKLIRKALQCVQMAHMVTETAEGTDDKETKIDALISKIKHSESE